MLMLSQITNPSFLTEIGSGDVDVWKLFLSACPCGKMLLLTLLCVGVQIIPQRVVRPWVETEVAAEIAVLVVQRHADQQGKSVELALFQSVQVPTYPAELLPVGRTRLAEAESYLCSATMGLL